MRLPDVLLSRVFCRLLLSVIREIKQIRYFAEEEHDRQLKNRLMKSNAAISEFSVKTQKKSVPGS